MFKLKVVYFITHQSKSESAYLSIGSCVKLKLTIEIQK